MFTKSMTHPAPIMLIAAVLISGGVSYAAEGSLPGDLLYPVKLGVNEEVGAWAAFSAESSAHWEVKRAERRLEEAETLAAQGNLDVNVSAAIEEKFERHAAKVKDRINKFEAKQDFKAAVDVGSNFEASLKAHEKILDKLSQKESKLKLIRERVRVRADDMVNTNAGARMREGAQNSGGNNSEFEIRGGVEIKDDRDAGDGKTRNSVETESSLRIELEVPQP